MAEGRSSKQGKSGLEPLAFEGLYVPGWGNGLVPDAPTRRDWDINSEAELRPPPPQLLSSGAGAVPGAHWEEGPGFCARAQILTPRESGSTPHHHHAMWDPWNQAPPPQLPRGPGLSLGPVEILRTYRYLFG